MIDLGMNPQIGDQVAKCLAGALEVNMTLEEITLDSIGIQIGDEGAEKLIGAFEKSDTLQGLILHQDEDNQMQTRIQAILDSPDWLRKVAAMCLLQLHH